MELTAVISTIRHGEKDAGGALTGTGAVQARERGLGITHLKGDLILMHSGVGRVEDTIRTAGRYIHLTAENVIEELEDEASLQTYVSPYLHYLYDPDNKGELFGSWDAPDMDDQARTVRMQNFLNQGKTSVEKNIYPSPFDMFLRVAKVVTTQIEFALLTESRFRTNFINGTHEPVLMSFVAYLLNQLNDPPADFVAKIGGSVDYAEGIDILVYQGANDHEITATFRNETVTLDLARLQKLAQSDQPFLLT